MGTKEFLRVVLRKVFEVCDLLKDVIDQEEFPPQIKGPPYPGTDIEEQTPWGDPHGDLPPDA